MDSENNLFGHSILENQIQALSRTMSVFKDFAGLENLEKNLMTFMDLQELYWSAVNRAVVQFSNGIDFEIVRNWWWSFDMWGLM